MVAACSVAVGGVGEDRVDRCESGVAGADAVTALLGAPDRTTIAGRRDHALLQMAVTTGMRISELTGLKITDIHLGPGAHALCHGKGRKDRGTPLDRETVAVLRVFIAERATTHGYLL